MKINPPKPTSASQRSFGFSGSGYQQRHVIEVRTKTIFVICSTRRKHFHIETECAKQRGEETIQFVADTFAPAGHDLFEERVVVKNDWLVGVNTQILKRNT